MWLWWVGILIKIWRRWKKLRRWRRWWRRWRWRQISSDKRQRNCQRSKKEWWLVAMFCKYIYFSKCTPINGKGGGSKHHVVEKWYNVTIVTTEDNDWKCWKWRFPQVFVANLVLERSRVFFRHQPSHKGGLPITMSPLFPETDFLRLPLKMLYSRAARMKHANYVMRDKKRGVVYTWLAIHPTKYIMLMKCTSR